VVSGNATVITLMLTAGLAMALVIGLWLHAWQKDQPAVGLVLAAIVASGLAAALKASSLQFNMGGWEFDLNSLYHVAQMPGLLLLLVAIKRRAAATGGETQRRGANVAVPV